MTIPAQPTLPERMLPAEIVLTSGWWHLYAGITFDEDFRNYLSELTHLP